ncbi:MAG: bifunctional UDP-sugar hydrolase/5'-nucleotidase [Proteobacteria bacterium]|nr:bifunctional UDP-sugar hydrolase/5'-nucleotidase [Pseudomonadota bacterium]
MKMNKLKPVLILVTFILYSSLLSAYQAGKTYKLTILHTNDHHGRFWKNKRAEYGMAARKTLIDKIRSEVFSDGGFVLLLSGGDINTGVPESDLQNAEPDFKGMSRLGYDAMALGNHEFDNPLSVLREQEMWSNFPFLSANIFIKGTNKRLFRSHVTYSYDGLKVTIVGFTTEDTKIIGNPEYLGGITFKSPVSVAKRLIPNLKKKTDVLLAVTHMGHYKNGNYGGNAPGDITLARSVKGIDAIIGGHSQNPIFEPDMQNGTMILQAYEWGKYVGRLDLEFRDGELTRKNYRLIPVNLTKKVVLNGKKVRKLMEDQIPEDQGMLDFLRPYQEVGQKELQTIVGTVDGVLVGERGKVRNEETNLGNLIAMAQMEKTQSDIGVMNSGGIRANLEAGDISYKDILIVQPFGNTLCTVTFNGDELRDYLEVLANKRKGSGAFAQFTGVDLKLDGERLVEVKVNGRLVMSKGSYKLSLNSYIASGGDGYPNVKKHRTFVNTGYVDADMLKEYVEKHSPLRISEYAPTNDVMR